ncbi:MAG: cytidylyltransferase domain-containing protein [Promethearchaeota archaeon]
MKSNNNIIAIIQARTGSTRLPNKVMKTINGITILELMINRVTPCKLLRKVVVATTTNKQDLPIINLCDKLDVDSYQGNEEDVLDRFYQCAKLYTPEAIIRLTSDCPLIDSQWIDKLIQFYLDHKNEYDYFSNCLEPTLPDGLDVELIPFRTLKKAWGEAKKGYEREHVSPYIYKNPNLFRLASLRNDVDYSYHRWTLDTPEDFEFIKAVYNHFFEKGEQTFHMKDILDFLIKNPHIMAINSDSKRNWKFLKQIQEDEERRVH